ncbi:MAG: MAPEG family protein [Rhodobiaceae bacterium]|nr:MAPEG family protein [Rhodobiaceae bacterium]
MEFPIITAYVAALIGILQFALMMSVGLTRASLKVGFGDGGDEDLLVKIRRHGNLAENAPIFVLLLGLLELAGQSPTWVAYLGGLFVAARIAHALALSGFLPSILRPFGAFGTLISGVGAAVLLLMALSTM